MKNRKNWRKKFDERGLFSRVLKIFTWFFVQKKAENSYFINQKFFTPWFETYIYHMTSYFPAFAVDCITSTLKKWGKKLVRGVKNFWFLKYELSAFFCTKNHVKIFKTHRENFFHIPRWLCFFFTKKNRCGNNRRHPLSLRKQIRLN